MPLGSQRVRRIAGANYDRCLDIKDTAKGMVIAMQGVSTMLTLKLLCTLSATAYIKEGIVNVSAPLHFLLFHVQSSVKFM